MTNGFFLTITKWIVHVCTKERKSTIARIIRHLYNTYIYLTCTVYKITKCI